MSGLYDNYLSFAGKDLRTFNAIVVHRQILNAPARSYTRINIPGKNGVRYVDEGTFGNVAQSYTLIITEDFRENYDALKNYLFSVGNYARLEEEIHGEGSDYYMMARVTGLTPRASDDMSMGYAIVTFDRLPQKFLVSGETFAALTSGDNVKNETLYTAKPIIRVSGHGTIIISPTTNPDAAIYYARIDESTYPYIDIDSEIDDCYCGNANCNSLVHVNTGYFPELEPGNNIVTLTGVTAQIMPRWWML